LSFDFEEGETPSAALKHLKSESEKIITDGWLHLCLKNNIVLETIAWALSLLMYW